MLQADSAICTVCLVQPNNEESALVLAAAQYDGVTYFSWTPQGIEENPTPADVENGYGLQKRTPLGIDAAQRRWPIQLYTRFLTVSHIGFPVQINKSRLG
jgi:hypothetical protein